MQALRQTLGAAVRWGYMRSNPAKLAGRNRQPSPRPVRAFTARRARGDRGRAVADVPAAARVRRRDRAAAEEWQALERRDVDRRAGCSTCGAPSPAARWSSWARPTGSRRQVPLSRRALDALDALRRGSTRRCCSRPRGAARSTSTTSAAASGHRRSRPPGSRSPARIYDLRSTFASNALAAGVSVFELARIMGTSVRMIERHYGALLDGAGAESPVGWMRSTECATTAVAGGV